MQLFGCYLIAQRQQAGIGFDVFARGTTRSAEWVASIERGTTAPSPLGLHALERGFPEGASGVDVESLGNAYQRLDAEPFGELARELRENFKLIPRTHYSDDNDPDGVFPLIQLIRFQDRMLTVTPLILLSAVIIFFIAGQPWKGNGIDLPKLDFGAISFLGLGIIAIASLVLPTASRLFQWLCDVTRFGRARRWHAEVCAIREEEQAIVARSSWSIAEEMPFMIPRLGEEFRSIGLETDLYERILVVLGIANFAGVLSVVVSVFVSPAISSWLPWAAVGLATGAATIAASGRRGALAASAAVALEDACGGTIV